MSFSATLISGVNDSFVWWFYSSPEIIGTYVPSGPLILKFFSKTVTMLKTIQTPMNKTTFDNVN